MQRELNVYVEDIIQAIGKIEKYISDMEKEDFINNELVQDAVIRNLEVIGEAVKRIPNDVRSSYEEVPWRKISGLRDILIHEYFGININIVWDVIENKLQPLKVVVVELQKIYD